MKLATAKILEKNMKKEPLKLKTLKGEIPFPANIDRTGLMNNIMAKVHDLNPYRMVVKKVNGKPKFCYFRDLNGKLSDALGFGFRGEGLSQDEKERLQDLLESEVKKLKHKWVEIDDKGKVFRLSSTLDLEADSDSSNDTMIFMIKDLFA